MCSNIKFIYIACLLSIYGLVPVSMQQSGDYYYYPIETPVPRVVNGTRATEGQFPYQISLRRAIEGPGVDSTKVKYFNFCGGSIIGKDKILTAAHCIAKDGNWCDKVCGKKPKVVPTKGIYAVAGSLISRTMYEDEKTSQWRRIAKGIPFRKYKFPKDDIALIYVTEPFSFDDHVASIPYATVEKDYHQTICKVSGFGRTEKNEAGGSLYLLWANIDVVSQKECSQRFKGVMKTPRFVCADDTYSDAHKGDSGGPLVCFNTGDPAEESLGVIVGVVSGARKCKKVKCGAFYTRVSSFKAFLVSATKNKEIIHYYYFLILFYFCQNLIFI